MTLTLPTLTIPAPWWRATTGRRAMPTKEVMPHV